jgi:hypothetical protein
MLTRPQATIIAAIAAIIIAIALPLLVRWEWELINSNGSVLSKLHKWIEAPLCAPPTYCD